MNKVSTKTPTNCSVPSFKTSQQMND